MSLDFLDEEKPKMSLSTRVKKTVDQPKLSNAMENYYSPKKFKGPLISWNNSESWCEQEHFGQDDCSDYINKTSNGFQIINYDRRNIQSREDRIFMFEKIIYFFSSLCKENASLCQVAITNVTPHYYTSLGPNDSNEPVLYAN
ncbi:hypothetical protein BpHYR1_006771 [Brachionus plicatilis]|uniref:Uncharacterized protein n=1 Tax=Brachionus plicatilis TaxID=10195 RepID=A0A3M7SYL0_BRAPC|nr:hypothetical protein BpHYR1_006771 [Brachionus plicatilis]